MHGARHGWDKLEHVASVAELMKRSPSLDWAAVWQRADAMHCRRMVAFGLLLAHALFDAPLRPEAAAAWRSNPLRRMAGQIVRDGRATDPPAVTLMRRTARGLRLKDTYTDRVRSVAREFVTATPDDWALVDLPGPLCVGYPLVRAVRRARKHSFVPHPSAGGGQ